MNHEFYLQQTFAVALKSRENGNHPFGALLVSQDGEVIASAQNTVNTSKDVSRHAEMNLISWANRYVRKDVLKEAILYSSTEPCAMCTGAIVWSGISQIVYSCSSQTLAEIAGGGSTNCRDIFRGYRADGIILGPLIEEDGKRVHDHFW